MCFICFEMNQSFFNFDPRGFVYLHGIFDFSYSEL